MRPVPDAVVTCLNCGRVAGPRYCGHCGQALDAHRAPLASLLREAIEEALSIDGRTLRTARALLRPGELTRLYLSGQRVRFLTPLRLYLTASVLLFSSVLALTPPNANDINLFVAGELVTGPIKGGRPAIRIMEPSDRSTRWILNRYTDRFDELKRRPPQELVNRLAEQLRSVLPMALILFVPVLALALKLLYIRSGVLYVDHLVVGVHFQSALFVALAATWAILRAARLGFALNVLAYLVVFLLMLVVYLPRVLRRVYAQRVGVTALKTIALVLAYFALLQPLLGAAMFLVLSRL